MSRTALTALSIVASICMSHAGIAFPSEMSTSAWSEFMERHDLLWTVLPGDWTESAFLGNGLHGTAIFGDIDGGLRWDVGRSRIAVGRFVMPPAGPVDGFRMRLHLWNAEATGEWEGADGTLRWRTLTHASDPVTMIELAGPAALRDRPIRFIQDPPVCASAVFKTIEALGFGRRPWSTIKDEKVLAEVDKLKVKYKTPPLESGEADGIRWRQQPLERGGGYTVAWGERLLDNGKRLFAFTVDFEQKDSPGTERAVRDVKAALAADQNEWVQRHRDWWQDYYRQSFLSIPDTRMESFYWIQMYKLGAATRADRPAIDLMGPWTYRTPWPRIWWNLNIQLTYWPVYAANRLGIGESLVRMIDNGRQNLIGNVPNEEWRKDSAGIGRTSIWDCSSQVGKEPGNLTFALHNYWLHCRYEGADERLKDGLFPILKRSVGYYLHTLEEGPDGKLHTPLGISPEYKTEAEDTNYDLSLLRWGLQTLLGINERLELNDPLVAKWRSTLERLTPYPVDPATGYQVGKDVSFLHGHRHFSHLFMVYPLHLVDPTDPSEQDLIHQSVENWLSRGGLQGYSYTGGGAMRAWMGQGDEAARLMNTFLDRYLKPNTMYMEAGPVIETPLAGASTIHEMVLQSWAVDPFGVDIRVFPGVPGDWKDVCFHELRAEGGFLVSADRRDGRTRWVRIKSEAGNPCRVRTSLEGKLKAIGDRDFSLTAEKVPGGEVTVIDLRKGESVLLTSMGAPPEDIQVLPVKPMGALNTYGLHGEAGRRSILRAGQTVRQAKDGAFSLDAACAILKNGPKTEQKEKELNIGFWTNAKGSAAWKLDVKKPGRYAITIRAAASGSGNMVAFEAGDKFLEWKRESTGSWDVFKDFSVGTIELNAGETRLTIKSADGKAVMLNLVHVVLTPLEPPDAEEGAVIQKIAELKAAGYEIVDYHAHLKGGLTMDELLAHSEKTGIDYGVAFNAGVGFPITNDVALLASYEEHKDYPVYIAMQAEGREWVDMFSDEAIAKFDYVFTDAMTWTDRKGRRMRLWKPEEVHVDDKDDFMDQLVEQIVYVMEKEPIDLYVNSTFLPRELKPDYDALWTDDRMDRVIRAAVANDVAIEISSRLKLPSAKFIKKAKAAGVKFSMGTNNGNKNLGTLDYAIEMIEECGLEPDDFFKPVKKM